MNGSLKIFKENQRAMNNRLNMNDNRLNMMDKIIIVMEKILKTKHWILKVMKSLISKLCYYFIHTPHDSLDNNSVNFIFTPSSTTLLPIKGEMNKEINIEPPMARTYCTNN